MTKPDRAPIAPASVSGRCPNCPNLVESGGRGLGRVFCSTACRVAFASRSRDDGRALVAFVLAAVEARHAKPGTREAEICRQARSEMTAIARAILKQRKADGMPAAADYAETLIAGDVKYMDRKRR